MYYERIKWLAGVFQFFSFQKSMIALLPESCARFQNCTHKTRETVHISTSAISVIWNFQGCVGF